MEKMLGWAAQANAPLFFSEYIIPDSPRQEIDFLVQFQRLYLTMMDRNLLSGSRLGRVPKTAGALITENYDEKFWIEEFARP